MLKWIKIAVIPIITMSLLIVAVVLFDQFSYLLNGHAQVPVQRPNNGYYKTHFSNGSLKSKEFFHQGKKMGTWVYYHSNGTVKRTETYNHDHLDGIVTHYDSNQCVVFNEYYNFGHCYRREIVNDSLYQYEVALLPHGEALFESTCVSCHNEYKFPSAELTILKETLDSLDIASISIDSVHINVFDSLFLEKQQLSPITQPTLNKYDIQALIQFIENQKKKPKLPLNPRRHRIKGKIS